MTIATRAAHQISSFVKNSIMTLVLKKGASKAEMKQIEEQLQSLPSRKRLEARKFCGVLKLKEDPLAIQKKLRDEWE